MYFIYAVYVVFKDQFIAECERQSRLIAQSDDVMIHHLMDEALNEVDGWE